MLCETSGNLNLMTYFVQNPEYGVKCVAENAMKTCAMPTTGTTGSGGLDRPFGVASSLAKLNMGNCCISRQNPKNVNPLILCSQTGS